MKTLLAPLTGHKIDEIVLDASRIFGTPFSSHIECLHVRPDPASIIATSTTGLEVGLTTGVVCADLWDAVVAANEKTAKQARQTFDAFVRRHEISQKTSPDGAAGLSASWRELEGDYPKVVTRESRTRDLVIFGRSPEGETVPEIAAILSGGGKPSLLVSGEIPADVTSTIAIAWKPTAEAARAVTAAMPLLLKSSRVVVLTASEDENAAAAEACSNRLADQLRWHGVNVKAHHVPPDSLTAAEAVFAVSAEMGAKLLVMGAYSHGRVFETIFGGFTQHALNHARLPVFMAH